MIACAIAFASCRGGSCCDDPKPKPGAPTPNKPVVTAQDWLESAREQYEAGAEDIDLDGDGRRELHVVRKAGDPLVSRKEIDSDFDGHPDTIIDTTREAETIRIDRNRDGLFEYQRTTRFDEHLDVTVIKDTNGDFVSDLKLRFVQPNSTMPVTLWIEEDVNQSGKFSPKETRLVVAPFRQSGTISISESPRACSLDIEDWREQLESAFKGAKKKIAECLSCTNDAAATALSALIVSSHIELRCVDIDELPQRDDGVPLGHFSQPSPGELLIRVSYGAFHLDLEATIFHELLHGVFGGHTGESDQVWSCERACYGGGQSDRENCRLQTGPNECDYGWKGYITETQSSTIHLSGDVELDQKIVIFTNLKLDNGLLSVRVEEEGRISRAGLVVSTSVTNLSASEYVPVGVNPYSGDNQVHVSTHHVTPNGTRTTTTTGGDSVTTAESHTPIGVHQDFDRPRTGMHVVGSRMVSSSEGSRTTTTTLKWDFKRELTP